jgi:3-methyladenine DNA glycosylase AlkD
MNSQLITSPDIVEDNRVSILLITPDTDTLELVVAACRNLQTNFNIYVSNSQEDVEWINRVMLLVDKIFKNPTPVEVCDFLNSKEKETVTEL